MNVSHRQELVNELSQTTMIIPHVRRYCSVSYATDLTIQLGNSIQEPTGILMCCWLSQGMIRSTVAEPTLALRSQCPMILVEESSTSRRSTQTDDLVLRRLDREMIVVSDLVAG